MEQRKPKGEYNVAECQRAVDSVIAELTPEYSFLKAEPITVARFRRELWEEFKDYSDPDYNRAELLRIARERLNRL